MGFYLRRRIKLGGGIAFNLSKSGIGVSAGVKGFRVSTGPRGTQINAGRHGVYYRKSIGTRKRRQARRASGSTPSVVVVQQSDKSLNWFIRALYFATVGISFGALCTVLAWVLIISIVALPLGLRIINRLPQVMTLKPMNSTLHVSVHNGAVTVQQATVQQRGFLVRAIYFVLVGWWASGLWLLAAWALVVLTFGLGLPLAFWMFDRVPVVTTLRR